MLLKKMISEIEQHTGQEFDLTNRHHFYHLNKKICRLHKNELRQLSLVRQALESTAGENQLFNNRTQYTRDR